METPTRALMALVGLAAAVYALLGLSTCAVVAIAGQRILDGGVSALAGPGGDLRPAVVVGAVMAVAVLSGMWSLHRQLRATERLARVVRVGRIAPGPKLDAVASELRLDGRIDLVRSADTFAFTYGFLLPRIAISTTMLSSLDEPELRAVLTHERYHVRHRDPLKTLAARALPDAFFFLPILRVLRDRYLVGRELAADRRVVHKLGREPLAAALHRALVPADAWQPAAGAAIGGFELLPARISQLESGREPEQPPLAVLPVASSAVAVAGLAVAAAVSSGALPLGIARVHTEMATGTMGPTGAVGAAICASFWTWVACHIVIWLTARRSGPASR